MPTRPTAEKPDQRAPVPRWLILAFLIGVPVLFFMLGRMLGAGYVEIIAFTVLCLFGGCLAFFMR